ncbi:restriction endonuclease subunit S [Microbaculum marinisediminis]|uniref:Restriction endonuclease subunit S n=1 Tax=Microbaculum marinisediminis TaxID=2931392 RepID=A0AAW5QVU4_9HYPH|nr:restriction endonuclease subunit S [Microbaculum sp. A6E488]MCT8970793.1 restriction endonuclease subunit S [Microbaculum sp. A6E488]
MWSHATLGEVCQIQSGAGFPLKHQGCPKGDFPVFKVGDMNTVGNEDYLIETPNYISEEIRNALGAKVLPPESIVFPKVGGAIATNKKRRIKVASCVDNNIMGLIPDQEKISSDFLAWWMRGIDIYEFSNKANPPSITQATVKDWPIAIPPLEEQQRIVAVLNEAFRGLARARENAEANLQNARELFESIKADELGRCVSDGENVTLSDVAEIKSSLVDPREDSYIDMLHLGAGNMITGTDELIDVKTAREEKLKSGKYLFNETTVLYSKIRPYLRKAARPDFQGLCSADVYPLTPNPDKLDRDFLFHMLLGHDFTEYAISGSDRAGMPKVNRKHLFAYRFELPPLDMQRRIAEVIDEVHISCRALSELANKKIQDIEDLRQSLLQKAFAGELT